MMLAITLRKAALRSGDLVHLGEIGLLAVVLSLFPYSPDHLAAKPRVDEKEDSGMSDMPSS